MRDVYGLLNLPPDDISSPRTLIPAPFAPFGAALGGPQLSGPNDYVNIFSVPQPLATGPALADATTQWYNLDGGRGVLDGPTHGNWCGGNWSGGQYSPGPQMGSAPTIDSMDEVCKTHDFCYAQADGDRQRKLDCDRGLVGGLRALPDNPRDWQRPPPPDSSDQLTNWFREGAIKYFTPPESGPNVPRLPYGYPFGFKVY
jgi:hypothetical protein